jgi:Lrp/AsnC family transcriptional regulator for asnA, asnC and gidA
VIPRFNTGDSTDSLARCHAGGQDRPSNDEETRMRTAVAEKPPPSRASSHLDDISKLIVEQLQQDGRRSYADIARAVGLSEAAVRQRVQRLLDTGVMQIVAVTDPLQVGFRRQALIGLKVEGDLSAAAKRLAALDEVDYVVVCAGSFDLLIEVVCENDDHLLAILNDHVRAIPQVTSTETFVYLRLEKQTYTWGAR